MKPQPQIGHHIRFVKCTEVATVRFVVEDVLVCSWSQFAVTLVPNRAFETSDCHRISPWKRRHGRALHGTVAVQHRTPR